MIFLPPRGLGYRRDMKRDARSLLADRAIQLALGVHRCRRELIAHAAAFGEREGLEVVHLSILHAIGLQGPVKMGVLARSIVMGAPDMTRRAKQLEDRGLVARTRSATSQREVLIALTPAGEKLFQRSFCHLHEAHKAYFDERLSAAEQRELAKLVAKL
jgi:DNA-binding MarR family transcriptional regulator